METTRATLAATAALLVSLPALAGIAGADTGLAGHVETTEPVRLEGTVNATAQPGYVNALTTPVETTLTADGVDARIEWQRGYLTRGHPGEGSFRYAPGTGVDWHNFTGATVELARFSSVPQVLSLPGASTTFLSADAPGTIETETVENRSIARHGASKRAGTGDDVAGFFHTLEDPHVVLSGADRAKVTGNFTLFVNNVTIDVAHEEGTWSNWTGYDESNPNSPAGPLDNPTAKRYEIRATTLHVTNGTLWINATNAVDLYARDADTTVDGTVSAPSVSGKLLSDALRYAYDGSPLLLSGQGSLDLGLASERTDAGIQSTVPPLTLAPSGGFDVHETEGVDAIEAGAASAWSPFSSPGGWIWFGVGLLAAGMVGALARPSRSPDVHETLQAALDAAVEGWHKHRAEYWVQQGNVMLDRESFERARELFAKAHRASPEQVDAFWGLMEAHAEMGELDEALGVVEVALEQVGRDRLPRKLVFLWLDYAQEARDIEHLEEAWSIVAERKPDQALMMYVEDEYDGLRESEWVRAKVEELKTKLVAANPELEELFKDLGLLDDEEENGGDARAGPEVA